MSEPLIVTYAVDAKDNLSIVGDAWLQFAELNNAGEELKPDNVIGKSLWLFVRDESLQMIYKRLMDIARSSDEEIEFRFRCDSPAFRRFMRMRLQGRSDGAVLFISETLEIEAIDKSINIANASRGDRQLQRCSICNKFRRPSGDYGEIDEVVFEEELMNQDTPVRVIWGVCDDCNSSLKSIG